MAFFEGWPYTNFHDCNLDWVMETTRKVHVEVHQLHQELHRAINCEEQQRIDADVKLGERIDKEITDRTEADNALGARIDKEITDRTAADQQLQENINQEITDRQEAVSTEAAARQAADQQLQTAIDKEISDRTQAVTAEAEARAAADTALGQRIDAESADRTQAVNAEATTRQQADAALGARIDKEITDRTAKDSELETAIANEATTRANAITDLRDDLTHEISDRKAGDDALGARIDGITPQLLPAGGTQGQVLGKATGDNYAVAWQDPATAVNGLPKGGTVGQVLAKRGPDNFDTEWIDAPESGGTGEDPNAIRKDGTTTTTAAIPFAQGIQTPSITGTGTEGVAIEANLDLNNHAISGVLPGTDELDAVTVSQLNDKFADVHSIPVGGTAGQVLGKIDGTDYNVTWVDQTGGGSEGGNVPAGGTTGQVLAKSTDVDYQTEWITLPDSPEPAKIDAVTKNEQKQFLTAENHWEIGYDGDGGSSIQLFSPTGDSTKSVTIKSNSVNGQGSSIAVNRKSIAISSGGSERGQINMFGDTNGISITHGNSGIGIKNNNIRIDIGDTPVKPGQYLTSRDTSGNLMWSDGVQAETANAITGDHYYFVKRKIGMFPGFSNKVVYKVSVISKSGRVVATSDEGVVIPDGYRPTSDIECVIGSSEYGKGAPIIGTVKFNRSGSISYVFNSGNSIHVYGDQIIGEYILNVDE